MSDFLNSAWSVFIAVTTVVSLIACLVLLFGAELNSEIERQAAINAPVGTPRPRAAATTASPAIRDRQVPVAAKH